MKIFSHFFILFYLIFLCINSRKIYSISTIDGVDKLKIRAGYGYLGRSSELEAHSELELSLCEKKKCDDARESGYHNLVDIVEYLENRENLLKAKEQLFEYLSLQMAAIDKSFVGEIPKCLIGNKKVKKSHDNIRKLINGVHASSPSKISPENYYYGNKSKLSKSNSFFDSLNDNDLKNKIIAIEGSLIPDRIAKASLTYEYFELAKASICNSSSFNISYSRPTYCNHADFGNLDLLT